MSKPAWTPGPWTADTAGLSSTVREDYAPGKPVAEIWLAGQPDEVQHATAHLIAAAPDLYTALKDVLNAIDDKTWGTMYALERAMPDARAALAKAEGRQP